MYTPSYYCFPIFSVSHSSSFFFFFNDTATTEIYTLSLHDALPILRSRGWSWARVKMLPDTRSFHLADRGGGGRADRKSTRLNSSHLVISYAVFCLEKKKKNRKTSYSHMLRLTERTVI